MGLLRPSNKSGQHPRAALCVCANALQRNPNDAPAIVVSVQRTLSACPSREYRNDRRHGSFVERGLAPAARAWPDKVALMRAAI